MADEDTKLRLPPLLLHNLPIDTEKRKEKFAVEKFDGNYNSTNVEG